MPALLAVRGELGGLVHQPRRHAHAQRRDVQPAVREALERGDVAAVQALVPADEVRRRHADVVEVDLAGPGPALAHLRVVRAERDARARGGHQERRDAAGGRRVRVGAREDHEHVGERGVGDPALRPGDHPLVPVADGLRRERRRVGAGLGLGERERRDDLAGRQPRQPLLALLLGAAGSAAPGRRSRCWCRRASATTASSSRAPSRARPPRSSTARCRRRTRGSRTRRGPSPCTPRAAAAGTSSASSISSSRGTTCSRTNSRTDARTSAKSDGSTGILLVRDASECAHRWRSRCQDGAILTSSPGISPSAGRRPR